MPQPNQISTTRKPHSISARDLLSVPTGDITESGLRRNIDVGLQYVHSWLRGQGCVPIYNLMEDAATAEICRAQVWQWIRHGATLENGEPVTRKLVSDMVKDQKRHSSNGEKLELTAEVLERLMTDEEFTEFLTLACYEFLD